MKIATITSANLSSLRPSLDTINAVQARRGTPGDRVPEQARPPLTYAANAIGWTVPTAIYPQANGHAVVLMEDAAWAMLAPASRALFADLDVVGYPVGFHEGTAAP